MNTLPIPHVFLGQPLLFYNFSSHSRAEVLLTYLHVALHKGTAPVCTQVASQKLGVTRYFRQSLKARRICSCSRLGAIDQGDRCNQKEPILALAS